MYGRAENKWNLGWIEEGLIVLLAIVNAKNRSLVTQIRDIFA